MHRQTRLTTSILLAALVVVGCKPAEPPGPKRRVEKAGGYSFFPPSGWTPLKVAGNPFAMYLSLDQPPAALQFRRDLGLPDDTDVVAFVKHRSAQEYNSVELVDASDFTTDTGLEGLRIVFKNETTTKDGTPATVRQISYVFTNGGDTHAFWGGTPGELGSKYDPVFDAVAKSYRVEKVK